MERKHRAARIRRRKRGRDDGSYLRKQLCVQGRYSKIGGAEADIMLTLKGGRFEISNLSESSAATVLVPEQAVGAAVENLSQGAMRVEAHSDVAVGGEVEISSKKAPR